MNPTPFIQALQAQHRALELEIYDYKRYKGINHNEDPLLHQLKEAQQHIDWAIDALRGC